MAYDGSVNIDSKIDSSGFSKGLSKLGGIAKSSLGAVTGILGGAATALTGAAIAGVKYNAQMEQYNTSFTTMLGSAEKSSAMVADLKKFAADTPFEFPDLAKGAQTLLAFGTSADDVMPNLKMLGDISQGDKTKFDGLTLAFAQISSAGKLSGQDLLQCVNVGFNPLREISKKTGESMTDLKKRMEDGKISAQEVAEAFQSATSEGGEFYGAMEAQSKTFNGQLSNLKDSVHSFLGELTKGLQDSLKDTALPMVNGWMEQLQKAFSAGGVQGVVSAFGNVLSQAVTAIAAQAPQMIDLAVSLIQTLVQGLSDNAPQIANSAFAIISALATGILNLLPDIGNLALKLILSLAQSLSDHADQVVSGATQLITSLVNGLIQAAPELAKAAASLASSFFDALNKQHPVGTPLVGAVVAAIGAFKGFSGIVNNFDTATKAIKKFSDAGGLLHKLSAPLKTAGTDFKTLGGVAKTFGSGIKDKFETVQIAGMLMGDQLKSLGPKISTVFSGIGSGISNVFTTIAQNPIPAIIIAIVAGIIYLWNTNEGFRESVTNVWNAICGFFTNTIPAAWNTLVAFFSGIPAWWNGLWTQVGQFFSDCWNGIIQFFTTTIPAWIAFIGAWFAQLPYNIGFAIGQIIGFFINMGVSIWNWITVTLPQIIMGIVQWFAQLPGQIWTWLCNAVAYVQQWGSNTYNAAVNAASSAISAVIDWFCQLPGNIWNFLCNAISCIGEWGSQTLSEATSWASQTISSIGDWFSQLPGNIWNWLCQVISDIGSWGSSLISQGADAAQGLFDAVVNTVQQIPGKMLSIGEDIVHGIWNGISGAVGWLGDKISGFGNGIVDGIKSVLHIGSPSRVMQDEVGAWLPPGIANGFQKAMPKAAESMQKQLTGMTSRLQAAVSISHNVMRSQVASNAGTPYQVIEGRSHEPYNVGGDTFNFYEPVETPQAHARAVKRAKRELAYD
ncbi:tape measure protein [Caproicibacterium sp. BJN0003]|uniref:tape measure protein n=1 Tax=Caproicibacterium sp. BJN0003 TaxID=2994078 RepID=UPI0022566188|nr:tape measure protein [Caproicibacterium sp. BJN0003]UZT82900.1 tape measure protein [Caproicibacterium sp. BJN0003]